MRRILAAQAAAVTFTLTFSACTPQTPRVEELDADQTLSFPIEQDIAELDPALITSPSEVDILHNVFSGLYRFDDQLREVPDIAAGQPSVSADGLTYTFKLRHNARFSNGDPITVDDVLFSWNRAAARQGDYAWMFGLIGGYPDVAAAKSPRLAGLTKVDDFTLSVTLTKPASYFLTQVATWPFWLVDQNVIAAAGETTWTTSPDTLIGSGPFRMSARAPGQSMDFAPVPGWYGGKTGALTHVHIDVVADPATQVAQYEAGVYSLVGNARQGLAGADATRYATDPALKGQLSLAAAGITYWIGFNLKTGPFAGDAGRAGREAFSESIDRTALADALCVSRTECDEATGGLISKGLRGYLGDGADPDAKFDAAAAKAAYQAWDPAGVKVKNLAYAYDTDPLNKAICLNLAAQWKTNIGVAVACVELDRKTFIESRDAACQFPLFRQSWIADYDHPQDWFDNLAVTKATSSGACYSNPNLDQLVAASDAGAPGTGLSGYQAAGHLLVSDTVTAPLLYAVQSYVIHPYVKGAGGNALYDNLWTGVRIDKHAA